MDVGIQRAVEALTAAVRKERQFKAEKTQQRSKQAKPAAHWPEGQLRLDGFGGGD